MECIPMQTLMMVLNSLEFQTFYICTNSGGNGIARLFISFRLYYRKRISPILDYINIITHALKNEIKRQI